MINFIISGQPRYREIVHNKKYNNIRINNEKIIQLKKNIKNRINYLDIRSKKYKELGYSGKIIFKKCGAIENGFNELIYQADSYGFRENIDSRYRSSDYILLGDSYTESICENKPNDLKSRLVKKTGFSYLNLGFEGTDYPTQALNLIKYSKKGDFTGLIWFFYEGNDYEKKSYQVKESTRVIITQKIENVNYDININHKISLIFKFKVWIAELVRGPSVLIKFFKNYNNLLDKKDYDKVLLEVSNYLQNKNIHKKYIIYIPSWQKISLYKLKK